MTGGRVGVGENGKTLNGLMKGRGLTEGRGDVQKGITVPTQRTMENQGK